MKSEFSHMSALIVAHGRLLRGRGGEEISFLSFIADAVSSLSDRQTAACRLLHSNAVDGGGAVFARATFLARAHYCCRF